ncbi:MAG: hypothetical protein H0X34_03875 [Chthoniobacterales bacterium]|nr:hypothetical protein [Chthoniobacterales bacterium]
MSGWIPPDRSFFYGYIIRWLSVSTDSLTSLLIFQCFLGAMTAIFVSVICRSIFALSFNVSCLFGVLCALDPLQLLWERYLMTEAISLFFYVTMLLLSFIYLKERRLWQLALIQVVGVLAISLRISYLLLVQAQAVLLPLIAFFPEIRATVQGCLAGKINISILKAAAIHLIIGLSLMLLLHSSYKYLNGRLSHRKPSYLYVTGLNLLAMWAPALESADSPDPRLATLIAEGNQFGIRDPGARGIQLYRAGYLVNRWRHIETNPAIADKLGKQTAMHALFRQPSGVLMLGLDTFFGYWHIDQMRRQAKYELGNIPLPDQLRSNLGRFFHYVPAPKTAKREFSILQRYFLRAQPYYNLVVLAPLFCAILLFLLPNRYATLLLIHSSILLGTSVLFTVTATVRYLQPLSLLLILTAAAFLNWMSRPRDRLLFTKPGKV